MTKIEYRVVCPECVNDMSVDDFFNIHRRVLKRTHEKHKAEAAKRLHTNLNPRHEATIIEIDEEAIEYSMISNQV